MQAADLSHLVDASQMQPMQLSLRPAVVGVQRYWAVAGSGAARLRRSGSSSMARLLELSAVPRHSLVRKPKTGSGDFQS